MNSELIREALQGNSYAIGILAQYEKPWKLEKKIVYEAMKGNQYALEILKINDKFSTSYVEK